MNELAFYQEGFRWKNQVALKSALLFFDGLAFLVPEVKDDEFHQGYEWLFPYLKKEQLRIIRPKEISPESSKTIISQVVDELCHFATTEPSANPEQGNVAITELDSFKIGFNHYPDLVSMIASELDRLGLTVPSENKRFLKIDSAFGRLLLHLANQAVCSQMSTAETVLRPIYEQRGDVLHALRGVDGCGDSYKYCPILSDIGAINLDVGQIPVSELNDFRKQHREELIAYKTHLADVAIHLTLKKELLNSLEFDRAIEQRITQLNAIRESIESHRPDWRGNVKTILTAAGYVKDLVTMDGIGMTLSALQGALECTPSTSKWSLSYLVRAKQTLDPEGE